MTAAVGGGKDAAADCRCARGFFFAFAWAVVLVLICASGGSGQAPVSGRRVIERVGEEAPLGNDAVRFANGDVLTGEVEAIADGIVTMKPEMADSELAIPVGTLKEIVFKDVKEEAFFPGDRVVLVNGESLVAKLEKMSEGKIALLLPSAERLLLDAGNVAAVAFFREEEVLVEEDFEDGLAEGMRLEGGRWDVRRGWLVQTDSKATECYACLPLTQSGDLVYEWSVNTNVGGSTGLYFLASDPRLSQERAYFVRLMRKYLYVYACINGEEVYCGSYRLSLYRSRSEVQLRCETGRGLIEIWIDGIQVGLWRSAAPIRTGKYVILRTDGRGAFDSLRVVRKRGAVRPEAGDDPGSTDRLVLINGDVIMANVSAISEDSVLFAGSSDENVGEIEKGKVLWVRFGRELKPATRREGQAVFLTRSADRIFGELLSLNQEVARIKSDLAGPIDFRRRDLKKVVFKELP